MKQATKIDQIILLIQSLSKAEKRYIRLYTNLQSGDKNYMLIYNYASEGLSAEQIYAKFSEEVNEKSFEMAAKHLYLVLLDCLVQLRDKQDIQTSIFNYITKSNILFERELYDNAFSELEKARKLASMYEKDLLLLLIGRTELKYMRTIHFNGINEKILVNKQMQINDTMKYTRNINQHLQLYDILKHRIAYRGYARSNKQKEDLNDLVLSELNLIANHSYKGFEARKLHLLFQATYYLNAGNYKSAIRFYKELIALFEANRHLILNPPIYYLSAIEGALDSLHITGLYQEMPFFISKLKDISNGNYPTEFVVEVQAHIHLYELSGILNTGKFDKAELYATEYNDFLSKKATIAGPETQVKLYLQAAILHLCLGNISKARKSMKKILESGKSFHTLPSYKTARLINLVIQAESGNYDFFLNEINSIKRMIRYEKQIYITEKLLFRFLMAYPLPVFKKDKEKLWSQYQKEVSLIRQDKYEKQLLKTFDFVAWIESRLTSSGFQEILRRIQKESE
ncbi:MAG: hypothetical protein IJD84_01810 [Parabacteroides sp.]|nr:hypothetical protein [Parabacteroides sp.]